MSRVLRLPHKMHLASPKNCKLCEAFAKSETIRLAASCACHEKCTWQEAFAKSETIRLAQELRSPSSCAARSPTQTCSNLWRPQVRQLWKQSFPIKIAMRRSTIEKSCRNQHSLPFLQGILERILVLLVMCETDFIHLWLATPCPMYSYDKSRAVFFLAWRKLSMLPVHTWCQPWSLFSAHIGGASAHPLSPASGDATKNKGRKPPWKGCHERWANSRYWHFSL